MATLFMDPVNGNDANNGTTFALRFKTWLSGPTSARVAPGDVIRVIASPTPVSIGSGVWTNNTNNVVVTPSPSAFSVLVADCEAAWTATTNVTATAQATTVKIGTNAASLVVAAGFTTGKIAYFATGTLDLSAMQVINFWIRPNITISANTLSLRLCSDTIGDTAVNSYTIPYQMAGGVWYPIVVDTAGNLGASIQSVSLSALLDPGAATIFLDHIFTTKSNGASLLTMVGKADKLNWVASGTYAVGDRRIPTPENRTGFAYSVTAITTGIAGGTEPTWPTVTGTTVVDSGITWSCYALEDTWFPIAGITGGTIYFDMARNSASANRRDYQGETRTVATYVRGTLPQEFGGWLNEDGTEALPVTISGGWNTTDMSTRTGETWLHNKTDRDSSAWTATLLSGTQWKSIILDGFGLVGGTSYGASTLAARGALFENCDFVGNGQAGYVGINGTEGGARFIGCRFMRNGSTITGSGGVEFNGYEVDFSRCRFDENYFGYYTRVDQTGAIGLRIAFLDCTFIGNHAVGARVQGEHMEFYRCKFGSNFNAGGTTTSIDTGNTTAGNRGNYLMKDCSTTDAAWAVRANWNESHDVRLHMQNVGGVTTDHRIYHKNGWMATDTTTRNTTSGYSWRCRNDINSSTTFKWGSAQIPLAKIRCLAGQTKTVTVYHRRDSTTIQGLLYIKGGRYFGIPNDVEVSLAPSINTWVQSSTLTFTPTEDCVVELLFKYWDSNGTPTASLWIDDLSISDTI